LLYVLTQTKGPEWCKRKTIERKARQIDRQKSEHN
jgi:hypothetical protein